MKAIIKREELEKCSISRFLVNGECFFKFPDTLEVEIKTIVSEPGGIIKCVGDPKHIKFEKPKKKLLAPALYREITDGAKKLWGRWQLMTLLYSSLEDVQSSMLGESSTVQVIWPAPFNPQTGFYEIEKECPHQTKQSHGFGDKCMDCGKVLS